jgi:hypothetical protein
MSSEGCTLCILKMIGSLARSTMYPSIIVNLRSDEMSNLSAENFSCSLTELDEPSVPASDTRPEYSLQVRGQKKWQLVPMAVVCLHILCNSNFPDMWIAINVRALCSSFCHSCYLPIYQLLVLSGRLV